MRIIDLLLVKNDVGRVNIIEKPSWRNASNKYLSY
jgi:hypothetical protein